MQLNLVHTVSKNRLTFNSWQELNNHYDLFQKVLESPYILTFHVTQITNTKINVISEVTTYAFNLVDDNDSINNALRAQNTAMLEAMETPKTFVSSNHPNNVFNYYIYDSSTLVLYGIIKDKHLYSLVPLDAQPSIDDLTWQEVLQFFDLAVYYQVSILKSPCGLEPVKNFATQDRLISHLRTLDDKLLDHCLVSQVNVHNNIIVLTQYARNYLSLP